MTNLKDMLAKISKAKSQHRRMAAGVCILSLLVGLGVLWQMRFNGLALENMRSTNLAETELTAQTVPPSAVQIVSGGGNAVSADGKVTVSKTAAGTSIENVFDITLNVTTPVNIKEFSEKPDMAVMIVMDVSHTMNEAFGNETRAAAAIESAGKFIDQFTAKTADVSKLGVVLFNTSAKCPSSLAPQQCSTTAQASNIKNAVKNEVNAVVNSDNYSSSHERFTNIEAGIKLAKDMLNTLTNRNKFIIFLSDGFPTTYINNSTDYTGWDPYCTSGDAGDDGVFYDSVKGGYCTLGTSYSDKAAIRASEEAARAKGDGITIFSIGIDIGGQSIKKYAENPEYCLVDREGTTYEIGGYDSADDYKSWLKDTIGSGYYYNSTDPQGLQMAYDSIFGEILRLWSEEAEALWVANDPMPPEIDFIGFYTKNGSLVSERGALSGSNDENAENSAVFNFTDETIAWNLKKSGFTSATNGNSTTYSYALTYRVRLKNELAGFTEGKAYATNKQTTLSYKLRETMDGQTVISETREVDFPIPQVKGFLSELSFLKLGGTDSTTAAPLSGAGFTLSHDTANCSVCRGNSTPVEVTSITAVSDENGTVSFSNIPSGHRYSLVETEIPKTFTQNGDTYSVTVAYDVLKVYVTNNDGKTVEWNTTGNKIINYTGYQLPSAGGVGTAPFTLCGAAFMAVPLAIRRRYRRITKGGKKP